MKYFVTGASGFLGTHLIRLLIGDGHQVTGLVFEPERESAVRELGADTVVGGFDSEQLVPSLRGVDGLFHVAGFVSLNDRAEKTSRLVNVEGTRLVLEAARQAGVLRVVHTSSLVTIGGNLDGTELSEDSPWEFGNLEIAYLQTKRQGEQLALSYNSSDLDVVVCNPPGLIGPQDLWNSEAGVMFPLYLRNRVKIVPVVRNNWGDARDVARGHILAMQQGVAGERYFLGGINTTLEDLLGRLDRISGQPRMRRRLIDWPWTYLLGLAIEWFSKKPALSATNARFMRYAFWISNEKARRELGYAPRPIDETLEDSLNWFARRADS